MLKAIVDNAVYPVLICDYLQVLIPELSAWYWRIVVGVISFSIIIVLNLFGIDAVSWSQIIITIFIVMPAVLFVCLSFPYWGNISNLSPSNVPPTMDFGALMSNLIW